MFGLNSIGDLTDGKGYQAKVLSNQILEYLSNDAQYKMTNSEVKSELYHFTKPINIRGKVNSFGMIKCLRSIKKTITKMILKTINNNVVTLNP